MALPVFAVDEFPYDEDTFCTLDGNELDPNVEYLDTVTVILDGVLRKVTAEEYAQIQLEMALSEQLNESFLANSVNSPALVASIVDTSFHVDTPNIMSLFDRTQTTPITPWVAGNNLGAEISQGSSKTFEWSVNASVSVEIKRIIQLQLSGAFTASSATTWGSTHHVGPGERARVVFTPRMRYTPGNLISRDQTGAMVSTQYITAKQPIKVGSYADGLYELEYAG
ncbi:MAG: hypothetical protein HFF50_03415 [Lawsonibacter sp.]|nr:hypothetical protein [Lawsonibacter sp.]